MAYLPLSAVEMKRAEIFCHYDAAKEVLTLFAKVCIEMVIKVEN